MKCMTKSAKTKTKFLPLCLYFVTSLIPNIICISINIKDTCKTCDAFAAETKAMVDGPEKTAKMTQHELHLQKAEVA